MIASTESVSNRVTKLVTSMDKDLSDLVMTCLLLNEDSHKITQVVKRLTAKVASIEDLRFGLGLEETGVGLTPANVGPLSTGMLRSCQFRLKRWSLSVINPVFAGAVGTILPNPNAKSLGGRHCRAAIAPDPARATQTAFRGMVIAAVPAYLITFYLLPQMDGFTMFVLAVLPFIVLGAGIAASLGRPGEFGNAMLLLGNGMNPINEMQYDVVAFFNGVLATIMGVGVACLTQAVILPIDINRQRLAAERRLIQRIARAIQQTGMTRIAYLASVVRTLNDFLLLPGNAEATQDNRADGLINLWALGYEVVSLNQAGVPADLGVCRSKLVSSIAEFLQQPSERRLAAVESFSGEGYQSSLQALIQVAPDSPPDDRLISWAAGFSVICHRVHVQERLSNVSSKLQLLTNLGTYA